MADAFRITIEDCLPGYREHVAAQSRWMWLAILPASMGGFVPLLAKLHLGVPSRTSLTIGLAVALAALLATVVWAVKSAFREHRCNIESLPH